MMSAYGFDLTNGIDRRVDVYTRFRTKKHTQGNQFNDFGFYYQVEGFQEYKLFELNQDGYPTFGRVNSISFNNNGIIGMSGFSLNSGQLRINRATAGQTLDGVTISGYAYGGITGHSMWGVFSGSSVTNNDTYNFGKYLHIPDSSTSKQEWSLRYAAWKSGARLEFAAFFNDASFSLGDVTKEDSAILNVISNSKGVLFPRMTNTDFATIGSKAEGLHAWSTDDHAPLWFDGTDTIGFRFNRSTNKFQGFDGTNWVDLN